MFSPLPRPASAFIALALFLVAPSLAAEDSPQGADDPEERHTFADPLLVPVEPDDRREPGEEGFFIEPRGHVLFWGDVVDRPAGQGAAGGLYHRTRAGGTAGWRTIKLHASADLLAGRLAGPGIPTPPTIGDHGARPFYPAFHDLPSSVDARSLYVEWLSPVGVLQVGLQPSQWGLGLVANSGEDDDYFFGVPFGGDRAFRALFATAPLRPIGGPDFLDDIYFVVGADQVFRDENADYLAGDVAYQGVTSIFWQTEDHMLGAYAAYRDQTDRSGDELRALALDIAGHTTGQLSDDLSFSFGAEAAYLQGETTRADGPDLDRPLQVAAFGAAAHAELRHAPSGLRGQLRTGMATGDANPRNQSLHRFRFDPNYRAGLLLFDHHIPAWSQHSVDGAEDELTLRDIPRGIDNLVETGSVTNSLFIHPLALWDATSDLTFAAGFLTGWTHRSFRDLRATFEAGGAPVGVAGRPEAARFLGWELQTGVRYRYQVWRELTLEARGEAALLLPGPVFEDARFNPDSPTSLLRAYISASW